MKAIYEIIDLNKTRKEARKHLRPLGKKMMQQEIMQYMHYTSSVISIAESSSDENKILTAIEKMESDQSEIKEYISKVISCIYRLEENQRKALLGKYLKKWDDEEKVHYMHKSLSSVNNLIRNAEVDFAIIFGCVVYKERTDKQ